MPSINNNPPTPVNTPQPSLSSHQQQGQSPRLTPSGPSPETETVEEKINVFLGEHTAEVLEDRPASDLFPILPPEKANLLTRFYVGFSNALDRYKELNSWYEDKNIAGIDDVIRLFREDAFERLCPHGEHIKLGLGFEDKFGFKEKLTQENLLKWISRIKTNIKEEEHSIREIGEYLEWNIKEIDQAKDAYADAVKKAEAVKELMLSGIADKDKEVDKANEAEAVKELMLSGIADKDKEVGKANEAIALLMIRKLIREFSPPRGGKSQPSTSQGQDHMRDKIREALPNFSEEQSWSEVSKQIKVFFRQEWAKAIIEAIKIRHLLRPYLLATQISESGIRDSFYSPNSLTEKGLWVKIAQNFCVMSLHKHHPETPKSYNDLLKCYTEAERLFEGKKPIPLSHWEPMLKNKKEEEDLIHSYYAEKFEKITQNREKVCAFIKYSLQEKRGDPELVYLFNSLEKGYHLPASSSFYRTSCRITKKYFLKAILEDETAIKELCEEEKNHSFHYGLIRDVIQRDGVSLFLSEDLPPTTLFDNTYAIRLCDKIFKSLVESNKLKASEDERKQLENFFSGQLARYK